MNPATKRLSNALRASAAILVLSPCSLLSGCLIAGYSSSGGGFIWPGGLGLLLMLGFLLWLFLRQR